MWTINLLNKEKLAYYASPSPTRAVDVQQFNWCQIARSILYYSIIIVGPYEEAKSQVQGSHEYELLNLPKRQRAKRKVL